MRDNSRMYMCRHAYINTCTCIEHRNDTLAGSLAGDHLSAIGQLDQKINRTLVYLEEEQRSNHCSSLIDFCCQFHILGSHEFLCCCCFFSFLINPTPPSSSQAQPFPPFTGLQGSSLISSASSWIRPSFSANLNPKTPIWSSMGLSSLPAPSEGVLCVLLVNTALSISIFKGIVRAILHVIGIHLSATPSSSDSPEPTSEPFEFRRNPSETCMEEFRSRNPAIRFDTVCSCKRPEHDCAVCLTRFEPDSEINHLPCGHFFHKVCLEKWLDYWNITCPLCRTPLLPEEETSCFW
ncbi:hypothetical protein AAG906_040345 [Vitis piasezkii]